MAWPLPRETKDSHQVCDRTFGDFRKLPWGGGGGQKSVPQIIFMWRAHPDPVIFKYDYYHHYHYYYYDY